MQEQIPKRGAIALMMTLLFIIAITAALAVSLAYVQDSQKKVAQSRFLNQANVIVEDVLNFLRTSPQLKEVKDAQSLNLLLQTASMIPLEYHQMRLLIEIKSAAAKFNINTLGSSAKMREAFNNFLARYNVQDSAYLIALLVDNMRGHVEMQNKMYESDIFDDEMWLYRDKIASQKHLEKILDFYMKNRHDPAVQDIEWENLVRFGDTNDTALDLNYVTPMVWQMLVPTLDKDTSKAISEHIAVFKNLEDAGLTPQDAKLAKDVFKVKFYVPVLEINIDVEENNASAKIKFDYNLKTKKGKNFEFHI